VWSVWASRALLKAERATAFGVYHAHLDFFHLNEVYYESPHDTKVPAKFEFSETPTSNTEAGGISMELYC
jgi:hypothetical protein